MFFSEFYEISKNPFFTEHLRATASIFSRKHVKSCSWALNHKSVIQKKKKKTLGFLVHISQYFYNPKSYSKTWRSSPPEVFLGKGVLKICSKFTGEHPCRSVISIKLHSSLLHIFRTPAASGHDKKIMSWHETCSGLWYRIKSLPG